MKQDYVYIDSGIINKQEHDFLEVANILFVYLHKNYIMAIENIH